MRPRDLSNANERRARLLPSRETLSIERERERERVSREKRIDTIEWMRLINPGAEYSMSPMTLTSLARSRKIVTCDSV